MRDHVRHVTQPSSSMIPPSPIAAPWAPICSVEQGLLLSAWDVVKGLRLQQLSSRLFSGAPLLRLGQLVEKKL